MKTEPLRIGTRGSELALWQSRWVEKKLLERVHDLRTTICVIKTTGDSISDTPLSQIGTKGLFTKELERALLDHEVDAAVHSLKDIPTVLPEGLTIGAVTEREEAREVFIPHPQNPRRKLEGQQPGSVIATGSLRRRSQLLNKWPHLHIADIRGNLTTRISRLETSGWAGTVLAASGLRRLGLMDKAGELLALETMLPAVGQGALALQIRKDDPQTASLVATLDHEATRTAVTAERALLRILEGGCQIPIGAFARIEFDANDIPTVVLSAYVGSLDGRQAVRGEERGRPDDSGGVGEKLARQLLRNGADGILANIRESHGLPLS
jgi:hydroxymethylbilane synthase